MTTELRGRYSVTCRIFAGLAALLVSGLMTGGAYAQPKAPAAKFDAGPALNKAIRQPMLVERITKSYTLIAQKVLESRSQRQIEDSVAEFEKALKDLKAMAPTAVSLVVREANRMQYQ